jgi:NAD(P)-dependent dehydrogenase (short-subunit alcohol dehydrogenase family)
MATTSPQRSVALVTGANKGLGYEAARGLGAKGKVVFLGCRDEQRGRVVAERLQSEGIDARPLRLDVTEPKSINESVAQIQGDFGRLDILVNNAGISVEPAAQATVEGMRRIFETNLFGLVAVTLAFEPLLRASRSARVVNVSSSLGSLTRLQESQWGRYKLLAYGCSKSAVNAVTVLLSDRLQEHGIKINSACPGYCATDLNGRRGERSPTQGARIIVELATLGDEGPTGGFFDDAGKVPW